MSVLQFIADMSDFRGFHVEKVKIFLIDKFYFLISQSLETRGRLVTMELKKSVTLRLKSGFGF